MMRSGASTPRPRHSLPAALLTLLLACAPLVGCSLGADQNRLDIPGFNPSAAGSSDQANAALPV